MAHGRLLKVVAAELAETSCREVNTAVPYRSEKQRRFMHAAHPEIAERWDEKYGGKVKKKKKDKPKKSDYSKGYLKGY